jgi:ABC-type anion transport system duplicated permease subunit
VSPAFARRWKREAQPKFIDMNIAFGNGPPEAWGSALFAVVVVICGLVSTRSLMDLACRRYVVGDGDYAG